MPIVKTPIIPSKPTFARLDVPKTIDKKAICVFMATGFFLAGDTYWKHQKVLTPGTIATMDDVGFFKKSEPWFQWSYQPRNISFETALNEFSMLFETIIEEQVGNQQVILPLSGGLDSRTQAAALSYLGKPVTAYSYEFKGGYQETKIARSMAMACNFKFHGYQIPEGYLWNVLDDIAKIGGCYSEFTHPRQMAIIDKFDTMGTIFSLGHWGDVLFDKGIRNPIKTSQLPQYIYKLIVKHGGESLATNLWNHWKLEGTFKDYLLQRIETLLDAIPIENQSAKVRAFKSMYWAPRWTSANLSLFESVHPISLPYYDDRMCEFITTIPEAYLADRKLQVAYIKKRNQKLAKITWQPQRPFNLLNYQYNKFPVNFPYRAYHKVKRLLKIWFTKDYIERNWELQFIGKTNENNLRSYLLDEGLLDFIPSTITQTYFHQFIHENPTQNAHPVSMLLTLAVWYQKNKHLIA